MAFFDAFTLCLSFLLCPSNDGIDAQINEQEITGSNNFISLFTHFRLKFLITSYVLLAYHPLMSKFCQIEQTCEHGARAAT
jgi:hypothetical protein